ncbi:hypothetical protein JCM16814_16390 [Desulfobaculum senezii]
MSIVWIAACLWTSKDLLLNSEFRIQVPVFKQEPVISFPYDVELDKAALALGELWDKKWKSKEVIFQKSYESNLKPIFMLPYRWESAKTKEEFVFASISCMKNKITKRNKKLWIVVAHSFLPPILAFISGCALLWVILGFKKH